jgi:predicted GNAT family acetyltransferase
MNLHGIIRKWNDQKISIFVEEKDNMITIHSILISEEKKKQGIGYQIMQEIIDYAHKTGKKIELSQSFKNFYSSMIPEEV